VGKVTSVVLVTEGGDPRNFVSASHYVKVLGLNLKTHQSGKKRGRLAITKRGSGMARKYLYLAVLRFIQKDAVAKAWYEKKVARDGGRKMKALVALMRKLAKALFWVARGSVFDSSKLFNTKTLFKDRHRRVAVPA
jgi:transposase